ncbi:hypothetical protein [Bythopirellula goksoeyrii]|uniref:PEP-CTERM protein-sorting domain-containing protein n=1 Tax=Bythopirellula goksoeyrii TaxID=1400387 RepID=A0A5B9Q6G7_9BACT|nr:hypothetical protein [Bythopirellula goksoeyrii]QEG34608.1 hypothetical protein Pr1d_18890 [Bythopirellula goksoeyrii]
MRTLTLSLISSFALILLLVSQSNSQTVSHLSNPGTLHTITDISGFMTTGEDMGGMRVTAHFTPDLTTTNQTVFWTPGVAGAGSALGTGWRLDEAGDTWDNLWRLSADAPTGSNLTLYGLTLEGFLPSSQPVSVRATVFDRTDPFFGTDGSYRGNDLDAFASAGLWSHVRVVYFDEVDNLADPNLGPQGDVYRAMQIQFGQLIDTGQLPIFDPIPFLAGDELLFFQDTDTVGPRIPNGDPGDEGLPEPTSQILLLLGMILCQASRGRDRSK